MSNLVLCKHCNVEKGRDQFQPTHLQNHWYCCRECNAARRRARREADPKRIERLERLKLRAAEESAGLVTCNHCKVQKPSTDFYPSHLRAKCRTCKVCSRVKSRWNAKDRVARDPIGERKKRADSARSYVRRVRSDPKTGPQYRKRQLFWYAKKRAKELGREFTITLEDIVIPERCPVFGCLLMHNSVPGFKDNSPSLDRIDPSRGYVPGNVWVISWRANAIKRDATLDELRRLVTTLENLSSSTACSAQGLLAGLTVPAGLLREG